MESLHSGETADSDSNDFNGVLDMEISKYSLPTDTESNIPSGALPNRTAQGVEVGSAGNLDVQDIISCEEIILEDSLDGVAGTHVISSDHTYEAPPSNETVISMRETIKSQQRKIETLVGIIDDLLATVPAIPEDVIPDLLALGLKRNYLNSKTRKKPGRPKKSVSVKREAQRVSLRDKSKALGSAAIRPKIIRAKIQKIHSEPAGLPEHASDSDNEQMGECSGEYMDTPALNGDSSSEMPSAALTPKKTPGHSDTKVTQTSSFQCEFCPTILKSLTRYYVHRAENHSDHESAINCGDCLRTFFTDGGFKKHFNMCRIRKAQGLGVTLPVKTEGMAETLPKQSVIRSNGKWGPVKDEEEVIMNPFLCPKCKKRFDKQQNLLEHLFTVHNIKNIRRITARLDDMSTEQSSKTQAVSKYQATTNQSKGQGSTFLVKAYGCIQCKKSFLSAQEVKAHLCEGVKSSKQITSSTSQVVIQSTSMGNSSVNPDTQPFPVYQCLECSKCFLTKITLAGHTCDRSSSNVTLLETEAELPNHSVTPSELQDLETEPMEEWENSESTDTRNILQLQCQICSILFDSIADFQSHQCIFHTTDSHPVVKLENNTDIPEDPMGDDEHDGLSGSTQEESVSKPKRKTFKCEFCDAVYNSATRYYEHRSVKHSDHESAINCADCLRAFFTKTGYKQHLKRCAIWKAQGLCVTHPIKTENIEVQAEEIDIGDETLQDTLVKLGVDDQTAAQLANEAAKQNGSPSKVILMQGDEERADSEERTKPFKCPQCGKRFGKHIPLLSHLDKKHKIKSNTKKPRKWADRPTPHESGVCDKCGAVFTGMGALANHMRCHKKKAGGVVCKLCGVCVSSHRNLTTHVRGAHPGVAYYECDLCDKAFNYQLTLKNHMFRNHDGPPVYTCNVCGKGFVFNVSYDSHMRRHSNVRKYVCELCPDKAFVTQGEQIYHTVIHHTKERKYQCDLCPKKFKLSCQRASHVRFVHLNEKRFSCDICKKRFATRHLLRLHSFTHTGKKPMECPECGQGFTRKYRFRSHMKDVHGLIANTDDIKI